MPARRASEPHSRERVLAAAVAIADADGIAAVTMRRVAEALDCEAMTLYHYVDDKRGLLAGMVEAVVGEIVEASLDPGAPTTAENWREVVAARCLAARRVMLAHPWAPTLVAGQAQVPPNVFVIFEALVGTMAEAGCSYPLAHRAIHSLGSLLFGFTQELFEPAGGETEPSAVELEAMALAVPHLARIAEVAAHETAGSLSVCDTQAEFEFTMRLVLDGLEAHRVSQARP